MHGGEVSARKLPEHPKNIPGSRREEGLLENSWYSHVESLLGCTGVCPTGAPAQHPAQYHLREKENPQPYPGNKRMWLKGS